MMRTNDKNEARRVKFERPLEVRVMTIDGTWSGESLLIDVSDTEAEIATIGRAAVLNDEFFLVLTSFGKPVFRLCKKKWSDGTRMGVIFKNASSEMQSLEEVRREVEVVHGAGPPAGDRSLEEHVIP